jgi:hypothetical protein
MKKTKKSPKMGRPPKNGAARVLGTYLAPDVQADLKAYARELSAAAGHEVSHSDIVARAVRAYRPFLRWRKARRGGD